jgi:hypothetical protein
VQIAAPFVLNLFQLSAHHLGDFFGGFAGGRIDGEGNVIALIDHLRCSSGRAQSRALINGGQGAISCVPSVVTGAASALAAIAARKTRVGRIDPETPGTKISDARSPTG